MKTFNDLVWKKHTTGIGHHGVLFFENGYGVSVVRFWIIGCGYGSYTDNEDEWELAVLIGTADKYDLCYTTTITDDVLGHLSETEVTDIMRRVQLLPPCK
jgi:hypothetical protein